MQSSKICLPLNLLDFEMYSKNYVLSKKLDNPEVNYAVTQWLGLISIGFGITILTIAVVFLPLLLSSLETTRGNLRMNGELFKAKSNTLWSQMQSLKRSIYRRSIANDEIPFTILNALPKGFVPFPFQKFRIKAHPPAITPYEFRQLLEKEFPQLINDESPEEEKKFEDALKGDGTIIMSNDSPSLEETNKVTDPITESSNNPYESTEEMKSKIDEAMSNLELMETLSNAFELAEQEEKERQGEALLVKATMKSDLVNDTRELDNQKSFNISMTTGITVDSDMNISSENDFNSTQNSTPPSPDEILKTGMIASLEALGITLISDPKDLQKCKGDIGEPGSDGIDGLDGSPGLDGNPGLDGEKILSFEEYCNCP